MSWPKVACLANIPVPSTDLAASGVQEARYLLERKEPWWQAVSEQSCTDGWIPVLRMMWVEKGRRKGKASVLGIASKSVATMELTTMAINTVSYSHRLKDHKSHKSNGPGNGGRCTHSHSTSLSRAAVHMESSKS